MNDLKTIKRDLDKIRTWTNFEVVVNYSNVKSLGNNRRQHFDCSVKTGSNSLREAPARTLLRMTPGFATCLLSHRFLLPQLFWFSHSVALGSATSLQPYSSPFQIPLSQRFHISTFRNF